MALSFEQYVFVSSGLADGIELEQLLGFVDVDLATWTTGQQTFDETLSQEPELELRAEDLRIMARSVWTRAIAPLDDDVGAWIDFHRNLPAYDLQALSITPGDLGLLASRWGERIAGAPALRAQLAAALQTPPREVAVEPRLRPTIHVRDDGTGTGFFGSLEEISSALPFGGDKDEVRVAPPLSVPLPPPADDIDETGEIRSLFEGLILPFEERELEPESEPAQAPEKKPAPQKESAMLAPPSVDVTAPGVVITEGDALPFATGDASVPSPIGPLPQSGATGFVHMIDITPPQNIDMTAPPAAMRDEQPLPFAEGAPVAPAPTSHEPHDAAGMTAIGVVIRGPATPFVAPGDDMHRRLVDPAGLTIAQYAAVEEEIAANIYAAGRVLAQYGLSHATRRQHAVTLRRLFQQQPSTRHVWLRARAAYRAWRDRRGQR